MQVKCFMQCLNGLHEPILLEDSQQHVFGRALQTKINDKRCSKKQVELTAYYKEAKVQYKHVGQNNGGFHGSFTKLGEIYELADGDTFELLYGKYPHKIVFHSEPLKIQSIDTVKVTVHENMSQLKRKRDESSESTVKMNSATFQGKKWQSVFGGDLLVYNQFDLKRSKIAAYDMDGTLITTRSGCVFPKNINDWKIIFPNVPGKLKKLYHEGYKMIIFTNQLGISKGKITVNDIQSKIERVIEKLDVPFQVLVSTGKGKYRKPLLGMWEFFVKECNQGLEINRPGSFYIGDAAGRLEIPKQRKKDHSASDRLFALNIDIPFYTPEEHFIAQEPLPFKMPDFIPMKIDASVSLYSPPSTKVPCFPVEVILLVGFPASGKSTFVKKHLHKLGYAVANRDTLGSWQKCISLMEKCLQENQHIVIDNTNPDRASRQRYIEVSMKRKVPIRCFFMNVTRNHAQHNNKFRELSGSRHSRVNDLVFNSYRAKFEEPSLEEGFSEIVRVNFLPSFINNDHEKLYKLFLLEK